jgi:hypothetical protein
MKAVRGNEIDLETKFNNVFGTKNKGYTRVPLQYLYHILILYTRRQYLCYTYRLFGRRQYLSRQYLAVPMEALKKLV